jgi:cysteine-rich repeat protein
VKSFSAVISGYSLLVTYNALCGNGIKEGSEQCDGGPTCGPDCFLLPVCGDGVISGGEQCDDNNTQSGDGCSSTCQLEGVTNEVEPNGTTAEADSSPVQITGNTIIAGAIGAVADKDYFKVTVATPTVIRFETFEGLSKDCPNLTTLLRLYNSVGTQIYTDSTTGIKNCSAITVFLAAGTYYIQVEENGNNATIAQYLLEVAFQTDLGSEVEPNDTQAQANTAPAVVDVYVFGNHQLATESDWYAAQVPAGKSIRAEIIEGDTSETCESNGIDAQLWLHDVNGVQLGTDDDSGRGFCSLIDGTGATPVHTWAHNLTANTYFIRVAGHGTSGVSNQFNYRLVVTVR